jgi:hypothetical protein
VTTEEAIRFANEVKSRRSSPVARVDFNKLQGNRSSPVLTALEKRWWSGLIENVTDVQQRLDQIAADVEFLETFTPGAPPRRLQ